MGLLEMPGVLLGGIDALLPRAIPDALRVLAWGALAGVAGMALYRWVSPQQRLAAVRAELAVAQRALMDYDGDLSGLWPRLRRQFALALRQLLLTLGPSLLAGLPVILMWTWMMQRFDHVPPQAGEPVAVRVEPVQPGLRWMPLSLQPDAQGRVQLTWPAPGASLQLQDEHGRELARIDATTPPLLLQPGSLDWLFGRGQARLTVGGALQAVQVELVPRRFLPGLPGWLAGWETLYIAATIAASLFFRWRWRLL